MRGVAGRAGSAAHLVLGRASSGRRPGEVQSGSVVVAEKRGEWGVQCQVQGQKLAAAAA